jgi:hypothetical protein
VETALAALLFAGTLVDDAAAALGVPDGAAGLAFLCGDGFVRAVGGIEELRDRFSPRSLEGDGDGFDADLGDAADICLDGEGAAADFAPDACNCALAC